MKNAWLAILWSIGLALGAGYVAHVFPGMHFLGWMLVLCAIGAVGGWFYSNGNAAFEEKMSEEARGITALAVCVLGFAVIGFFTGHWVQAMIFTSVGLTTNLVFTALLNTPTFEPVVRPLSIACSALVIGLTIGFFGGLTGAENLATTVGQIAGVLALVLIFWVSVKGGGATVTRTALGTT